MWWGIIYNQSSKICWNICRIKKHLILNQLQILFSSQISRLIFDSFRKMLWKPAEDTSGYFCINVKQSKLIYIIYQQASNETELRKLSEAYLLISTVCIRRQNAKLKPIVDDWNLIYIRGANLRRHGVEVGRTSENAFAPVVAGENSLTTLRGKQWPCLGDTFLKMSKKKFCMFKFRLGEKGVGNKSTLSRSSEAQEKYYEK